MFELTDNLKKLIDPSCDLGVIAHGLARIGRFGGRGELYYPVLAHSIVVGSMTPWPWRIYGYLHDMAEVIVGDIGHPFKTDEQKDVEWIVHNYMLEQLGIPYPSTFHMSYIEEEVRKIDRSVVSSEAYLLHLDEVVDIEGEPDFVSVVYKSVHSYMCVRQERWFSVDGRKAEMPSFFVRQCMDAIEVLESWPNAKVENDGC